MSRKMRRLDLIWSEQLDCSSAGTTEHPDKGAVESRNVLRPPYDQSVRSFSSLLKKLLSRVCAGKTDRIQQVKKTECDITDRGGICFLLVPWRCDCWYVTAVSPSLLTHSLTHHWIICVLNELMSPLSIKIICLWILCLNSEHCWCPRKRRWSTRSDHGSLQLVDSVFGPRPSSLPVCDVCGFICVVKLDPERATAETGSARDATVPLTVTVWARAALEHEIIGPTCDEALDQNHRLFPISVSLISFRAVTSDLPAESCSTNRFRRRSSGGFGVGVGSFYWDRMIYVCAAFKVCVRKLCLCSSVFIDEDWVCCQLLYKQLSRLRIWGMNIKMPALGSDVFPAALWPWIINCRLKMAACPFTSLPYIPKISTAIRKPSAARQRTIGVQACSTFLLSDSAPALQTKNHWEETGSSELDEWFWARTGVSVTRDKDVWVNRTTETRVCRTVSTEEEEGLWEVMHLKQKLPASRELVFDRTHCSVLQETKEWNISHRTKIVWICSLSCSCYVTCWTRGRKHSILVSEGDCAEVGRRVHETLAGLGPGSWFLATGQ